MTVGEWLDGRSDGVPTHLVDAVRAALQADLGADASSLPDLAVSAADCLVAGLTRADATGRDSALTLLAADALATYAFEAAADDPSRLAARATAAMHLLATLR